MELHLSAHRAVIQFSLRIYTAALLELAYSQGFSLHEKTIGIIGVGNVGTKVWHKAEALGLRVLLNDPPLERQGSIFPLRSLDELMEADIVTLHIPLTRTGSMQRIIF